MPGIQLRQTQNKWRQLKTQYKTYEDNQRQSGRERKPEALHYDLMSSFLRNRPLSNPPQFLLEGASTSQQLYPTKIKSPDQFLTPHPVLPLQPVVTLPQSVGAVPQPVIPPHEVILPQQPQPQHQVQPPNQVQASYPVVPTHQEQGPELAQANTTLRTRRRIRPQTEKREILEVVKQMCDRIKASLDRTDVYRERQMTFLSNVDERQAEKHAIDMAIKQKKLAMLRWDT